jgi:hypothetical protein
MIKIGKTQEIKKKIPSLIFDIFRNGKVSFDIKNNNLYSKKGAFSRKLQNYRF